MAAVPDLRRTVLEGKRIRQMRMKKKTILFLAVVLVLLLGGMVSFRPLAFSGMAGENQQINMVLSEVGVRNGEAYIDSSDYSEITTEQRAAVWAVLEKYTYRRIPGTLFSDGSLSDIGEKMLSIYVYEDGTLKDSIVVTSSGKIAVNGKNYRMTNAEQCIDQLTEILESK